MLIIEARQVTYSVLNNIVTMEKLCLMPEDDHQGGALTQPAQGPTGIAAQLSEVLGTEVGQFVLLPVRQQILDRIQFPAHKREETPPTIARAAGG
jgi:hypothetical protein